MLRKIRKKYFAISIASGLLLIALGFLILFPGGIIPRISNRTLNYIPERVRVTITLTEDNFQAEVLQSPLPVLVNFWAQWCPPCRWLAPIIEEIAEKYSGRLKVGKVNIDENRDLAARYGIRSLPTLLIFKDGQIIKQITGALPKETLESKLEAIF